MRIASITVALCGAMFAFSAAAKLPPPSDEAKAKAAAAAPKTAWSDKVAAYKLCQAMNKAAENYRATMKQAGKAPLPPVETPACADPGPFVAPPPVEAAGAHSPPSTAKAPPSSTTPAAKMPKK